MLYICIATISFGTISGCTDCTIVVGAVEAMFLNDERVTLIASCKHCVLAIHLIMHFICLPCRPLLLGDNRSLFAHKYTYNPLIQHFEQARLIQSGSNNNSSTVVSNASSLPIEWPENLWNKPHDLDIDQDGDDIKLMEPEYFFPFAVPINDVVDDTMDTSNSNKSKRKRNKYNGPVPLPKNSRCH